MASSSIKPGWFLPDWEKLERRSLNTGSGRGIVHLVRHPRGLLLERQYLHGGFRRLFWQKLFFRTRRPGKEFRIHRDIYEKGLNTVEPIGWVQRPGPLPFLFHYFYYSRYIEGALPFPKQVRRKNYSSKHLADMSSTLYRLFEMGIFHNDLNLNNWIVAGEKTYLIDFDLALPFRGGAQAYVVRALRRMIRSGIKLGLGKKKWLLLRAVAKAAQAFRMDPKVLLHKLDLQRLGPKPLQKWRWKISGGHQEDAFD